MPDLTLPEAEARLHAHGGYDWLLSGRQAWSVSEVVKALAGSTGIQVSHDAVTRWFKSLSHTQDFGGPIGLRASRNDLITFFAGRMRGDGLTDAGEHAV